MFGGRDNPGASVRARRLCALVFPDPPPPPPPQTQGRSASGCRAWAHRATGRYPSVAEQIGTAVTEQPLFGGSNIRNEVPTLGRRRVRKWTIGRMRGGGVVVLALLGSAGAFIVSPTIGPLARRGFVAPSTPVVPDRAFPVATAELPEETNTFSKSSEPGSVCPDPDVHRPPFDA